MGWVLELAKGKHMDSCRSVAIRMEKQADWPKRGMQMASVANNLAKLDRGELVDWWLGDKGAPYRPLLARVLALPVDELTAQMDKGRPGEEDPDRYFVFEVFPRLRPIDLDEEEPFPGVPEALLDGDGLTGRHWWHAPAGAGRTLVGRWLARRFGWALARDGTRPPDRAFIEIAADDAGPTNLPRNTLVASPSPPKEPAGWRVIRPTQGWVDALVVWVEERLDAGRRYDPDAVARWLSDQANRASLETPGQLIELLALVDQVGPVALDAEVGGKEQLDAWTRAHASRPSRPVRPASRAFLIEHGAGSLVQIELERRARGLPVDAAQLAPLFPDCSPALSADALLEILDRDGREALQAALHPSPEALIEAMRALRWLLPTGWGFPSRVEALLLAEVAREGARRDHETLAGLLGDDALAEQLVVQLADPGVWSRQLEDCAGRDLDDPATLTVLDALLRASALAFAGGQAPSLADQRVLWRLLTRALQDAPEAWVLPLPAVGIARGAWRIVGDGVWFLATLTLTRALGAERDPPGPPWCTWMEPETTRDVEALAAGLGGLDMICHNSGAATPGTLRRLAVEIIRDLGERFPALHERRCRTLALLRVLSSSADAHLPIDALSAVDLQLVACAAEVLGQPAEQAFSRLWPLWLAKHGPPLWEGLSALLQRAWDLAPPGGWALAHVRDSLLQAERGVCIPDAVWAQLLPLVYAYEAPHAAAVVPESTLLAYLTREGGGAAQEAQEAQQALMLAAWRRCPAELHRWLEVQLQMDPEHAATARVLGGAPEGEHSRIVATVGQITTAHRRLAPAIANWLITRVRRRDTGWEAAWRVWLHTSRGVKA